MKLLAIDKFAGAEWGIFPIFPKGTTLSVIGDDDESPHWFPCLFDKQEFWTPSIYLEDGVLNCDYNPTSLSVEKGQIVTLLELVFEWVRVEDEAGQEGWLPTSVVVSI